MFKSKYPIICVTMNKVSDLKLALACHAAGIVPSLSIYNNSGYVFENEKEYYNYNVLKEIDHFIETTGSNEISLAIHASVLHNDMVFNLIKKSKNRLIEILDWVRTDVLDEKLLARLSELQAQGKKVSLKFNRSSVFNHSLTRKNLIDQSDFCLLKGNQGAGLVSDETLDELIVNVKKTTDKKIIATGGIANSADIKRVMSLGADAVGIGTLFALSEESRIPYDVKLKLLEKNKQDLVKVNSTHRGIMFSSIAEHSNNNLDKSLVTGIQTGTQGHINIGSGISEVFEIKPLKDIVDQLLDGITL